MDSRFFVAKTEKKEIYSMETMVNIVLLPWTVIEWGFSILVWYIVFSWIKGVAQGEDIGEIGDDVKNWFIDLYHDAKKALRFSNK